MYDDSDTSVNEADVFGSHTNNKRATTRKNMKSLFTEDTMHSKQGVTSLRYEDQSSANKAVSLSVMGGNSAPGHPPNTSSPLRTAIQAVAIAYKGETPFGTCVVAVCVPLANALVVTPLIAIVDREKRPQCRVRMDEGLQLLQNGSAPQYASLYDPSFGGHWSLMFKGRRECTEFVACVYTTIHSEELEKGLTPSFIEWGDGSSCNNGSSQVVSSRGDAVSISFVAWLLQRVPGTRFFSLGKMVEEVSPEAPREVKVGDGTLMEGIEEALVGMGTTGISRLVFVPPKKTGIRKGINNPEVSPSDTVIVLISCHEVFGRSKMKKSNELPASCFFEDYSPGDGARLTSPSAQTEPPSVQLPGNSIVGGSDMNTLLQTILLQTLQQQQNNKLAGNSINRDGGGGLEFIERSIDRVHLQLTSLYEKIDRLSFTEAIEKNNAAIERIVKKAVGKAPINDVDVEDMTKDRDSLLATIERLKQSLEEETNNYHRALEAMGRHKDEVHRMQNDLRIEQEAHASRVRQMEEQRRLQLVEAEVHHQQALDRLAKEKFFEGRELGFKEGVCAGKQEALEATGKQSDLAWRERLFASEQRAVQLESEMQERETRHIAERRRMQEQIDALQEMTVRLEKRAQDAAMISQQGVNGTSQKCKLLRRAMNATYTNIETQLYAVNQKTVEVEDVLRMVLFAIKFEIRTFTEEIKKEEALLWEPQDISSNLAKQRTSELCVQDDVSAETAAAETTVTNVVNKKNEEEDTQLGGDDFVCPDDLPPVPPPDISFWVCDNPPDAFSRPPKLVAEEINNDDDDKHKSSTDRDDDIHIGTKDSACVPRAALTEDNGDW